MRIFFFYSLASRRRFHHEAFLFRQPPSDVRENNLAKHLCTADERRRTFAFRARRTHTPHCRAKIPGSEAGAGARGERGRPPVRRATIAPIHFEPIARLAHFTRFAAQLLPTEASTHLFSVFLFVSD